jgi:hypothetical protein
VEEEFLLPYLKNKVKAKGKGMAQVVDHFPSKHKALSSIPSTAKKSSQCLKRNRYVKTDLNTTQYNMYQNTTQYPIGIYKYFVLKKLVLQKRF